MARTRPGKAPRDAPGPGGQQLCGAGSRPSSMRAFSFELSPGPQLICVSASPSLALMTSMPPRPRMVSALPPPISRLGPLEPSSVSSPSEAWASSNEEKVSFRPPVAVPASRSMIPAEPLLKLMKSRPGPPSALSLDAPDPGAKLSLPAPRQARSAPLLPLTWSSPPRERMISSEPSPVSSSARFVPIRALSPATNMPWQDVRSVAPASQPSPTGLGTPRASARSGFAGCLAPRRRDAVEGCARVVGEDVRKRLGARPHEDGVAHGEGAVV